MSDSWTSAPGHRAYLLGEALRLLEFFRASVDAKGRFVELDDDGRPMPTGCPPAPSPRQNLLTVARAVHSYSLGELLGVPGCAAIVERGLEALWTEHRDASAGGYLDAVDAAGAPVGSAGAPGGSKSAYGHAFVVLAGSSAATAGHDGASELLEDSLAVVEERFWSEEDGAASEAFSAEWVELEPYRGANSNMHLCEAFLAAADARGDARLALRAERLARRFLDMNARERGWLLPEHYDVGWRALPEHNRERPDDPFRPYGVTIGHLLEWARLAISVGLATGRLEPWLLECAAGLFDRATTLGWDEVHGGLCYTIGWDGAAVDADHYWWPVAEGIGAASYLARALGDAEGTYESWYRRFWEFAATHLVDHERGGWYPQLDEQNRHKVHPWYGKPDVYHALQACLLPLFPLAPSVAAALRPAEGAARPWEQVVAEAAGRRPGRKEQR
jgi:mannose/cellobiose epimerase-like protein (N-acyl-D-glucosamine 2-epimerase family)